MPRWFSLKRRVGSLKKRFTASTRKRHAKRIAAGLMAAAVTYGANKYHKTAIQNAQKELHDRYGQMNEGQQQTMKELVDKLKNAEEEIISMTARNKILQNKLGVKGTVKSNWD